VCAQADAIEIMPAKLERCVEQVMGQGHSRDSAYAICNAAISGKAKPDGVEDMLWNKAIEIVGPVDNALKAISETDNEFVVGNYIVLFGGRDLTAFGNVGNTEPARKNADGSAGEFFTKATELESNYTAIGRLPEDWEHGQDGDPGMPQRDDVLGYVDWATKAIDEQGVFVKRVLNKRNKYVQWLKDLITAGLVGTSSEAVDTGVKVKANGEIELWPLKRDTLTIKPMDWRNTKEFGGNVLTAAKALGLIPDLPTAQQAGLPADTSPKEKAMHDVFELQGKYYIYAVDENGEATGDPVSKPFDTPELAKAEMMKMDAGAADNQPPAGQAVEPPKPQRIKGAKTMPTKTVDEVIVELSARLKAAEAKLAAPAIFNGRASEPAEPRESRGPFKSLGDQVKAVIKTALAPNDADPRIAQYNLKRQSEFKALGMNEGTLDAGGAFVQTEYSNTLIERVYDIGKVLARVPEQPLGPNSNAFSALLIDESSRANGSRFGGVQVYRIGEGGTLLPTRPKLRRKEIKPGKIGAVVYLTDESLEDATQLEGMVNRQYPQEASFKMEDELFNGSGAGESTGILKAAATISVTKDNVQPAATLTYKNLVNMWERLWPGSEGQAKFYANKTIFPQLMQMTIPAGTGGLSPLGVTFAGGKFNIFGADVEFVEYLPALGTVGDISLVDFSQYLGVSKGGMKTDSSMHVAFLTAEMVLRFIIRYQAEPLWNVALTPKAGNSLSPYITLETRS